MYVFSILLSPHTHRIQYTCTVSVYYKIHCVMCVHLLHRVDYTYHEDGRTIIGSLALKSHFEKCQICVVGTLIIVVYF